jgi:hypothetical protein
VRHVATAQSWPSGGTSRADEERRAVRHGGAGDARDRREPFHARVQQRTRPRRVVAVGGGRDLDRERVVRVEPRIVRREVREAAEEEQRGCQEQRGAGDLRDDEEAPETGGAGSGERRVHLQAAQQVRARRVKRRDERRQQARDGREDGGEADDARVDAHVQPLRDRRRQAERGQQVGAPDRHDHRGGAADRGEQQALGEHLPQDARPARAERGADADLTLPIRGAREQQPGDVEAGDEQHDADHAEPHPAVTGDAPDLRVSFGDRREVCRTRLVRCRIVHGQARRDCLEIGAGLRAGHAGLHPAHDRQPVFTARPRGRREVQDVVPLERHPERRLEQAAGALESVGHHADDREVAAVQREGAAGQRPAAAEPFVPEALGDDDRQLVAIARTEQAPESRLRAQHVEVVR